MTGVQTCALPISLMPPLTTSAVGVAFTTVVVPAPPAVVRLCERDGLLRFEVPPPPLPLPPPPVGDAGVEL